MVWLTSAISEVFNPKSGLPRPEGEHALFAFDAYEHAATADFERELESLNEFYGPRTHLWRLAQQARERETEREHQMAELEARQRNPQHIAQRVQKAVELTIEEWHHIWQPAAAFSEESLYALEKALDRKICRRWRKSEGDGYAYMLGLSLYLGQTLVWRFSGRWDYRYPPEENRVWVGEQEFHLFEILQQRVKEGREGLLLECYWQAQAAAEKCNQHEHRRR